MGGGTGVVIKARRRHFDAIDQTLTYLTKVAEGASVSGSAFEYNKF
jgi:hypothetical protein